MSEARGGAGPAAPGVGPTRMDSERILIVDDNQDLLELFEDLLRFLGYSVSTLDAPPASIAPIKELAPAAVVLDLNFGGREFEGWRLLQLLRADRELVSLPVIICTANRAQVVGQEGWLSAHRVWVLLKPFVLEDLQRVLDEALATPQPATAGGRP